MAKDRKKQDNGDGRLGDPETIERNRELYGMGAGLFGNPEGDEDIENSPMNSYYKNDEETGLRMDPPEGEGPVDDIAALIHPRWRADDAPGAVIPWQRRDEALEDLLSEYGDSLSEVEGADVLCGQLLTDVENERMFEALRLRLESVGILDLPTWGEAQAYRKHLHEYYGGAMGIGGELSGIRTQPWDRPSYSPFGEDEKREVPGFDFSIPLPPRESPLKSRNRVKAGEENARKPGMHSRMAKARELIPQLARNDVGKDNGDRMRGAAGPDFRRSGTKMKMAAGKYNDISDGHVVLKEGKPRLQDGMPWFHGKVRRENVGGVPSIVVNEGHIICSGSLPRPKFTEGFQVWDAEIPLGEFDMQIAFSQLSEGLESVRPWCKIKGDRMVMGIPTEGVIVESNGDDLSFMIFDSASGYDAAQQWMVENYVSGRGYPALLEAVTYGYVRANTPDLILDRVIRKLNRLNVLDVFEDAVFDKGAEALYVLLNPTLEESEVQEIATGLQQEYPNIEILGGPLDEDVDWWVLYMPKSLNDSGPQLQRIFEPSLKRPVDAPAPDLIGQAIRQVVKL